MKFVNFVSPFGRLTAVASFVASASSAWAQSTSVNQGATRDSARGSIASAKTPFAPSPATALASQSTARSSADSLAAIGAAGDAIARARSDFERTGIAREVRAGTRLVLPFGRSQPTLTCSPLHLCLVELEPGEVILTKGAGDPTRWIIQEGSAGADGTTPLLAIKPTRCDIATNFVASTTRRIYEITLDAPPCPAGRAGGPQDAYARHISFWYPDEDLTAFAAGTRPRAARAADSRSPDANGGTLAVAPERLNFDYHIQRDKHFPWMPQQIFDDGARAFIKLPPEAERGVAPVLFVLEDDGAQTILNYVIRDGMYVTDRAFRRAVLVIGEHDATQKLTIENQSYGKARSAR